MQKRSIFVIAEKEYHRTYQEVFLDVEKVEAHGFENAIDAIKNCNADIILIDSGFNIEKGLSLIEAAKNLCFNIPIILLSAVSSEETAITAFKLGVRDYIKKPVSISELKSVIENILTLKRHAKERRSPYIPKKESDKNYLTVVDSNNTAIIRGIIKYINDNLSETISLDLLAKKANMSKYYFCRLFKRYTGKSPMNFVIFTRIERAKELLKSVNNISTVAIEVGFNDPVNFTRQFKRITGSAPSSYLKKLQEQFLPKK